MVLSRYRQLFFFMERWNALTDEQKACLELSARNMAHSLYSWVMGGALATTAENLFEMSSLPEADTRELTRAALVMWQEEAAKSERESDRYPFQCCHDYRTGLKMLIRRYLAIQDGISEFTGRALLDILTGVLGLIVQKWNIPSGTSSRCLATARFAIAAWRKTRIDCTCWPRLAIC